jgi:O-antigen/teichoic acid export membrane protein
MDVSERRHFDVFLETWRAFAVAAVPSMLGSVWATGRVGATLSPIDLAEWALLIALLTVVGSVSQFGIKPGYMQEVSDRGGEHRHAALRAALLMVGVSGIAAGVIVAGLLYVLSMHGHWHNVAVLPWLPLYGLLANVGMMFHTDLRILGGARVLAIIAIVTFPLFVATLEFLLWVGSDPLAAFFATQCALALLVAALLAARSGVLQASGIDARFLRRALLMGLPVMGGLLAKYVADFAVSGTFRWGVDTVSAGGYGLAVRVTEPLMILYIGSFQMAWGAHVYGWIKESPRGDLVAQHAARSWWLAAVGLPLGFVIAWLIILATDIAANDHVATDRTSEAVVAWWFIAMMISRTLAFGMASAMGFGQTLQRNYRMGMRYALIEMLLSVTLLPFTAVVLGAKTAAAVAAVIPWLTVWRLRAMSRVTVVASSVPPAPSSSAHPG